MRLFGVSYKYLDSYNWQLMKLLQESPGPIFDYVYLTLYRRCSES